MAKSIPRLTVVIPCRETDLATATLESLKTQTFKDFKIIIQHDKGKGANWARNEGFKKVDTEFVLFSDNDIEWKHNALEKLVAVLDKFPKASYSYGRYKLGENIWCNQPWWPELLKHHNYISTMSIIRTKDFPGFDESLTRLQDWDLWLNLLINHNKRGIYCGELIFETKIKSGITFDDKLDPSSTYFDAEKAIKTKYGLNEFTPQLPQR